MFFELKFLLNFLDIWIKIIKKELSDFNLEIKSSVYVV